MPVACPRPDALVVVAVVTVVVAVAVAVAAVVVVAVAVAAVAVVTVAVVVVAVAVAVVVVVASARFLMVVAALGALLLRLWQTTACTASWPGGPQWQQRMTEVRALSLVHVKLNTPRQWRWLWLWWSLQRPMRLVLALAAARLALIEEATRRAKWDLG